MGEADLLINASSSRRDTKSSRPHPFTRSTLTSRLDKTFRASTCRSITIGSNRREPPLKGRQRIESSSPANAKAVYRTALHDNASVEEQHPQHKWRQ